MAERRGNNEGSIYRLADGSWCAAVTVRPGKRRRLRRDSYAEALKARDALLRERDQRVELDRKLTVGQLLDEWLALVRESGRRPRTYEAYEGTARKHVKPALGSIRAAALAPADVRRLYQHLLDELSPASLVKVRAVLMGALGWAVEEERLPRNVAAIVRLPERNRYKPVRLTVEQTIAVLKAIVDHEHGPLWTFMLATGCRFGEAAGRTWADVDLETGTVAMEVAMTRVPKAFRDNGGAWWEIEETKTERSRRSVPLMGFAAAALVRQAELVERLRAAAGPRWQEHGLVFPSRVGTPLRNDHVLERWHALIADVRLPDGSAVPQCRLHDLRHTLGTLHRRAGTDLKTVQELLGHASIQMTADVYVGGVPEALREATRRVERLLTSPTEQP